MTTGNIISIGPVQPLLSVLFTVSRLSYQCLCLYPRLAPSLPPLSHLAAATTRLNILVRLGRIALHELIISGLSIALSFPLDLARVRLAADSRFSEVIPLLKRVYAVVRQKLHYIFIFFP
jgi:hypothetical protein